VLHRIHELRWLCLREDGQKEDRRKCMALVLRWEYASIPSLEIGEQEQDLGYTKLNVNISYLLTYLSVRIVLGRRPSHGPFSRPSY
jgi:hypothetical protein